MSERTFRFTVENPNTRLDFDIDITLLPKPAHEPQRTFRTIVGGRFMGCWSHPSDEDAGALVDHLLSLGAEEITDAD